MPFYSKSSGRSGRRFSPAVNPATETPEQRRAREDREEIRNARTRQQMGRSTASWKADQHADWQIQQQFAAKKPA